MAEQMYVKLGDICLSCDPPEQGVGGGFSEQPARQVEEQNMCGVIPWMGVVDVTVEQPSTSVVEGRDPLLLSLTRQLQLGVLKAKIEKVEPKKLGTGKRCTKKGTH